MSAFRRSALLLIALALGACRAEPPQAKPVTWRSDCPPLEHPAPLSMETARQAHRWAERRHEIRQREAAVPGSFVREMRTALDSDRLAAGEMCLSEVAERGQLLFEHEYNYPDGLGGSIEQVSSRGPFRRIHEGLVGGPETLSCMSCHWVGGPNGAGAETDNAFLLGDGGGLASADSRNPPALVALGVVQALAREMSQDLQRQRDDLLESVRSGAKTWEIELNSKGVDYGRLRVAAGGELDFSDVVGVDRDLTVKPFGWKGTATSIADFTKDALQVHMGIQSAALAIGGTAASTDSKDDDEIGRGPFAAVVAHLALLEMPIVEPLIQDRQLPPAAEVLLAPTTTSFVDDFNHGRRLFHDLGCAECHRPMLVLKDPVLHLDGLPPIDLAQAMRQPALTYDAALGGYPVWLFSDLRRHDMGEANRAHNVQRAVATEEYLTPRLWGVAGSAPYLHDGRAPSFDYAIAGHDGEGADARAAFAPLSREEKGALRVYLMSLRRVPRLFVP